MGASGGLKVVSFELRDRQIESFVYTVHIQICYLLLFQSWIDCVFTEYSYSSSISLLDYTQVTLSREYYVIVIAISGRD